MRRAAIFALCLLIVLAMLDICSCYNELLVESIRSAYSRLVEAEKKGADVREAAAKLNRALQLIREAEDNPENRSVLLSEAYALIEDVNLSISLLIREGENRVFWKNVTISLAGVLTVVISILAYRFGPRIFWEAWLRLRSKWTIKTIRNYKNKGGGR